jgi:hypothetical protein
MNDVRIILLALVTYGVTALMVPGLTRLIGRK